MVVVIINSAKRGAALDYGVRSNGLKVFPRDLQDFSENDCPGMSGNRALGASFFGFSTSGTTFPKL